MHRDCGLTLMQISDADFFRAELLFIGITDPVNNRKDLQRCTEITCLWQINLNKLSPAVFHFHCYSVL